MTQTKHTSPERAQITHPVGMKAEMQVKREVASLHLVNSTPISTEAGQGKRKYQSLPKVAALISMEESKRKRKCTHA